MEDHKNISYNVAEKLMRELTNNSYRVTPVNLSRITDNWDIEKIYVTKDGRDLCDINCQTGTISYMNSFDRDEINMILELIKNIKEQEGVFTKAQFMEVEGVGRYKLLSQFNEVVLAACEITTLDYKNQKVHQFDYVTWEKDKAADGVHAGNYFGENYTAAREDFAKRSGLINKDKLFSETEMLVIRSGLIKLLESEELDFDQQNVTAKIINKIEALIPDIEEKINSHNPSYIESEKNSYVAHDEDDENEYEI